MGLFIAFEGPDGSGKSTQVDLLAAALLERGFSVVTTHEPGGTPVGDVLRDLLLDRKAPTMQPLTQVFVLNAARAELTSQVIKPALARGAIVLSDRYAYSTIAYQSAGEGVDSTTTRILTDIATQGLEPDLVVLLDLPPAAGIARKTPSQMNRFDLRPLDFHERVRQSYREMADASPERWLVLDAERPIAELAHSILERTLALIANSHPPTRSLKAATNGHCDEPGRGNRGQRAYSPTEE
jgi:dTMP kinase